MTERTVVKVECNVMRMTTLDGPIEWSKGDYTKVYSDGTEENATYDEYSASIGLPPMANVEVAE